MSGEKRHQVKTRYYPIRKVTVHDLRAMYDVFARYYENVTLEEFIADMCAKTGIFILFDQQTRAIVGFSTVKRTRIDVDGRRATGVFSGDTILDRAYWGNKSLQVAFYWLLFREKLKHPLSPLFWLLISKGYKTYLLLANNFRRYYPHPEGLFDWLEPYAETYCRLMFPDSFCPQRKLLDFGEGSAHLKGEVTPITREMRRRHPKIRFFEQRNPTWHRGTELPCIGLWGFGDIVRFPFLVLMKNWRRMRPGSAVVRYE